jgi:hypothetical protein
MTQARIRTQLELPPKLHRWVAREAEETGNSRSYVMRALMVEAIRARQAANRKVQEEVK